MQADTVTVNLHYSQTKEGHSTEDNLFGHKIFSGPHFLTMALYVFCDQSQKLTAPPAPDPDPRVAPKLNPSLICTIPICPYIRQNRQSMYGMGLAERFARPALP